MKIRGGESWDLIWQYTVLNKGLLLLFITNQSSKPKEDALYN